MRGGIVEMNIFTQPSLEAIQFTISQSMRSRISERFDRLIEGRGHATTVDASDGRLRDMNGHQQD